MALLSLESLPPRATKTDILQLLSETGGLDRKRVGRIDLRGGAALVEIPDGWEARLVKALDGAICGPRRIRASLVSSTSNTGDEDHFQRLTRLLDLESRAEAAQASARLARLTPEEAERTGDSLAGLVVRDEFAGLGGRVLVTLTKKNRDRPLPWTRLQVGAPVLLSVKGTATAQSWRGVVSERETHSIQVALNDWPEDLSDQSLLRIDLSTDEAGRARQRAALERVRIASRDRLAELRQVLVGEAAPQFNPEMPLEPLDATLNTSQQEAVRFALAAEDVAVIHGPPGTGKTTAVVEVIRQAVRRGNKVLACAPSNLAVDNLLEKLIAADMRALRLGHPARVLPQLREHTLDVLVDEHGDVKLSRKLIKEARALFRKAGKWTRAKPQPGERRDMRQEARDLLGDARRLEAEAVEQLLANADVLCATLTGVDSEVLGTRSFDLVVIDEAGQSTEPACWIPLVRGRRLILAGDHCQLPPTVVSQDATAQGFAVSLLERLARHYGPSITRLLQVQYRMHEAIMGFSSQEFYNGALTADASVREHLLRDLPGVRSHFLTETPLQFIDTAGAGYDEEQEPDGESRFNPQEAQLIVRLVRTLRACGVRAEDLAVIAPYAAQVRLLREQINEPGLEIDSVDGFQGREKEAVLVSLVRSNLNGEIGFLADTRRINVALTRARRKLIVVGDSATLAAHPFYQHLLEYVETVDAYHTVWEEEALLG